MKYGLRKNLYKLPNSKTTSYGVESVTFRGRFLWNALDDSIKQEPKIARLKKIKNWADDQCTSRI